VKEIACGQCGTALDEPSDTPIEDRSPCPACGSTLRRYAVALEGKITFRERIHLKKFEGKAKGRAAEEIIQGDDFNSDTGRWFDLKRRIDRTNDRYSERIVDPESGEVVREVNEPLSEHRGRGDARKKRRQNPA
jgi:hypothetical protein